ncbi:hypothetical protein SYNPS1DRAFT_31256 [Syncephalis pseudoplumigaleata]|uniref:Ribosomal protein/NADH dehydrogenase domain-containing protein n=1 Tax=Syncephalis pseudoplumigaleata TaxID=1712513 RepID=A0A4P9YV05_9FUNG|nr:hypothetical protein SYNPS1DRAFT_31256 [Syncephalis pseudoplumigaleata]|eukprot:RKP23051.1 hypothetical protein SYNPS1DRAFT_31256 [Syncephalis pseudoplumigaleata]
MSQTRVQSIVARLSQGLGAQQLPNVRKVTLTLHRNSANFGARYFIRENLPRLQYSNPQVEFRIARVATPQQPKFTVQMPLTAMHAVDGSIKEMPIKRTTSEQVCREFIKLTGATPAAV